MLIQEMFLETSRRFFLQKTETRIQQEKSFIFQAAIPWARFSGNSDPQKNVIIYRDGTFYEGNIICFYVFVICWMLNFKTYPQKQLPVSIRILLVELTGSLIQMAETFSIRSLPQMEMEGNWNMIDVVFFMPASYIIVILIITWLLNFC